MDRRRFLKSAAIATGAVVAAACAPEPGPADGPSSSAASSDVGSPTFATRNDMASLAAEMPGRVVLPGDPTYGSTRVVYNPIYDYARPAAIVQARDVEDIRTTLTFAHDNDIEFVLRSGAHSFNGLSVTPGIVLDVSRLNQIQANPSTNTTTIGAGAKLIDVAIALSDTGKAVPSGSCPSVGFAGLALGGGIGFLTRHVGLTCDSLRSVELVLADGSLVHASEEEHPDLYWASRGGGGSSAGVVTAFEMDLHPVDVPFNRYELQWPWEQRARAFEQWQEWAATSPRNTTGIFKFTTDKDAETPALILDGIFMGPTDEADAQLAELIRRVGSAPSVRTSEVTDYLGAVKDDFCKDITLEQCRLESQIPPGKVNRWALSVKSDFVRSPWPDEAVETIAEWLERRQRDRLLMREPADENLGKVWLELMGGAVGDLAPGATAFPFRDAQFCAQFQSRWDAGAPTDVQEANIEWIRGFYDAMAPWRSGDMYVNYGDQDGDVTEANYFGSNLPRLQAIRRRYDPNRIFANPIS